MPSERLVVDNDRMTVACPECDHPDVFVRRGDNAYAGDPDAAFLCSECGETFDEAVVREYHPSAGGNAKYADLDPEDVPALQD